MTEWLPSRNHLTVCRYVSDPERTRQALDSQGFFKTGDAADIQGDEVHLLGRIGLDCELQTLLSFVAAKQGSP